jgi:hypothetical protein
MNISSRMIIQGLVLLSMWVDSRHEGNPEALASLTKEIRRVSMNGKVTPSSTPAGSYVPDTPGSKQSTGHDSSRSIPLTLPVPSSYRSLKTPSPTPDDPTHQQHYPTPPPQSSNTSPQQPHPLTIRPPPAVARIAGKENKKNSVSSGPFSPPTTHPTSHPTSPPKENQSKSGIMSWGKKEKDTRSEKWESGVIGRERARVIIGYNKRCFPS